MDFHNITRPKNSFPQKTPRRLPQELPAGQERYTEEISSLSPAERARNVVTIDRMELLESQVSPDNNPFFEERSNPLSSKGN